MVKMIFKIFQFRQGIVRFNKLRFNKKKMNGV